MASFTKKVLGLAAVATTFASMAFGQAQCTNPQASTTLIRAEGTTEQVAPLTWTCTVPAGGAALAGTVSVQIFLSPSLPITSKLATGSTTVTDALLSASTNGGAAVTATGSLTGNNTSLVFSVAVGALAAGQNYTFTINNVRVNASSLSVGAGVPPSISESAFISGPSVAAAALLATPVAYAQNGISSKLQKTFVSTGFPNGTSATAGSNNYVVCNATSPAVDAYVGGAGALTPKSLAFTVVVSENFAGAFKDNSVSAGSNANQVGANAASTADRIAVNFTNVPTNATLYIPSGTIASVTAGSVATIKGVTTATGSTALTTSTSTDVNGLAVAAAGSTVYFNVATQDNAFLDVFNIPVLVVFKSNVVPVSSAGVGVTVSYAPVGSTQIPNFVVSPASTTSLTGSVFNACTTSLLFPFVTNQAGFDTGLAISNTSTDPFGTTLGATPQGGTCSLNFYGDKAPSPNSVVTANVPTGTTFTQVLSGVAANFQGYIIAQCNFQYAHGFAFITNGVGVNGGLSQGYLAGVIPDVNQTGGRPASDPSKSAAGTGETLGN